MIAMERNMHGNPLIIASVYIPHENTNDEIIRQRAWEDHRVYNRNAGSN